MWQMTKWFQETKKRGEGGRLALLQTVMNAFRGRRTRREKKTRSGGFVFSFAVTSQDLLFRCSEQFLTVGRSYQKQSFLSSPPAPSASTTPTPRPPQLQRVAFFKTGGDLLRAHKHRVDTHMPSSLAGKGIQKNSGWVFNLRRAPSRLITKIRL